MIPILEFFIFEPPFLAGGISAIFPPTTITRDFLPNFTILWHYFEKYFPESPLPTIPFFEIWPFWASAPRGWISVWFPRCDYEGFSNFTTLFRKVSPQNHRFRESIPQNRDFWWSPFWDFAIFEPPPLEGLFPPDIHPLQFRGISLFQFYDTNLESISQNRHFLGSIFQNHHVWRSPFWDFSFFDPPPLAGGFLSDFSPLQLRWLFFSNFTILRHYFEKYFP